MIIKFKNKMNENEQQEINKIYRSFEKKKGTKFER